MEGKILLALLCFIIVAVTQSWTAPAEDVHVMDSREEKVAPGEVDSLQEAEGMKEEDLDPGLRRIRRQVVDSRGYYSYGYYPVTYSNGDRGARRPQNYFYYSYYNPYYPQYYPGTNVPGGTSPDGSMSTQPPLTYPYYPNDYPPVTSVPGGTSPDGSMSTQLPLNYLYYSYYYPRGTNIPGGSMSPLNYLYYSYYYPAPGTNIPGGTNMPGGTSPDGSV